LEAHGIPFGPQLVKHYGYYSEKDEKIIDEKIIDELLSMPDPPTAIFAGYDPLAIGAINTLHRKGKAIPKDLSVIGFGDIMMAPYCHPPLTTLKEPMEEIGQKTALLLIDQIEKRGKISELRTMVLRPELVVRDSCGPVPQ
jgi:DNA-binding LacI/PurR family transcriptional regulator